MARGHTRRAGPDYVVARAAAEPAPRRRSGTDRGPACWSAAVGAGRSSLIAALAGLLFTTTARTAAGTNLRDDRRPELTRLIGERQGQVEERGEPGRRPARRDRRGHPGPGRLGRPRRRSSRSAPTPAEPAAGFTAVHGPGVRVVLDDAPRRPDGSLPAGARPDDVVVHQQDVQSVVNALWAGGAEAMVIMDIRVISTSAVRCVGNTLLLHGRVYSPPFEIEAIGDQRGMPPRSTPMRASPRSSRRPPRTGSATAPNGWPTSWPPPTAARAPSSTPRPRADALGHVLGECPLGRASRGLFPAKSPPGRPVAAGLRLRTERSAPNVRMDLAPAAVRPARQAHRFHAADRGRGGGTVVLGVPGRRAAAAVRRRPGRRRPGCTRSTRWDPCAYW